MENQSLVLLQAEPSDAIEILEMHIASFSNPYEPVFFLLFPENEDRKKGARRMVDWWLSDPTATYTKVVDNKTGKIISAAKWCIHKESATEAQQQEKLHFDWLTDADSNEWGEEVCNFLHQEQISRLKDSGCCIIDMLSTHPDHQRRGAGSMLMDWGIEIADNLGLKAFVQGSRLGTHLYESYGFVNEGWVTVPVTEKHRERPKTGWFDLERPVKVISLEAKDSV